MSVCIITVYRGVLWSLSFNSLADMQLEAKRLKEKNEQLLQVAYSNVYHCNRDGRYYRNSIDTTDTSTVSNSIGIEYLKIH